MSNATERHALEARLDQARSAALRPHTPTPSPAQLAWLRRGIEAPGGKLPLFDRLGRETPRRVIEAAVRAGWAEPWFTNPIKPGWLVCRLTPAGRALVERLDARR